MNGDCYAFFSSNELNNEIKKLYKEVHNLLCSAEKLNSYASEVLASEQVWNITNPIKNLEIEIYNKTHSDMFQNPQIAYYVLREGKVSKRFIGIPTNYSLVNEGIFCVVVPEKIENHVKGANIYYNSKLVEVLGNI
ncbi:MAG: hypothetical protein QXF15_00780 [Candidatus Aenigmatarchaeota archaeon]